MSNLREQYERETGKPPFYNMGIAKQEYVAWLERLAACAAELAAVCRRVASCPDDTNNDGNCGMRYCPFCGVSGLKQALAAYEAVCKGS